MQLIGDEGIDLAFLPIGDYYTMGPDDSVRAVNLIRPRFVVPIHYNTFPPITQDVDAWATRIQAERPPSRSSSSRAIGSISPRSEGDDQHVRDHQCWFTAAAHHFIAASRHLAAAAGPAVHGRRYHRMIQAGIIGEDDDVELLEGWIVPKMSKNPPHDTMISIVMMDALTPRLPAGFHCRGQSVVTTIESEPSRISPWFVA